ncbi:DUF6932 family protein [Tenacibaculum finnmarkense]|uniref:DUF6932 family protein n=1 Tax=Tenacibaculum finnmarkense TaxID=2781243 RepID=UPI00187BA3BE|nr:hypothetical protein [Tenacibaculum finnmarkense]MBE7691512.1 hypothetical protein [Tenacibaculum finnmarkense genomovar finnmarkense]
MLEEGIKLKIPNFDHNHVLPPHLGNPTQPKDLSPYPCNTLELCERFSFSKERKNILKNFLKFRKKLNELHIIEGFQWLDGSFLENIEMSENRAPNDLDLVTFFKNISFERQFEINNIFPDFASASTSKANFLLDHFIVDYSYNPDVAVESTRYWIQLFTHNRNGVWKGMIRIELNTPEIDNLAIEYLNTL